MALTPLSPAEFYGLLGKLKRSYPRHTDAVDYMANGIEDGVNSILQARSVDAAATPQQVVKPIDSNLQSQSSVKNKAPTPVLVHGENYEDDGGFSPLSSPVKKQPSNITNKKSKFSVNIWNCSGAYLSLETTPKIHIKLVGSKKLPNVFSQTKQVTIIASTKGDAERAMKLLSPKTKFREVFVLADFPAGVPCNLENSPRTPVYYVGSEPEKAAKMITRTLNTLAPADRHRNFISKFCDASLLSPNPDRRRTSPVRRDPRKQNESTTVPYKRPRTMTATESHEGIQFEKIVTYVPRQAAKSLSAMLDAAAGIVSRRTEVKKAAPDTDQSKKIEVVGAEEQVPTKPQVDSTLNGQDDATAQKDGANENGTEENNDAQMTAEGDSGGEEGEIERSQMDENTEDIEVLSDEQAPLAIDESANEGEGDDPFEF